MAPNGPGANLAILSENLPFFAEPPLFAGFLAALPTPEAFLAQLNKRVMVRCLWLQQIVVIWRESALR
jgi:hypothetical protein